MRAGIGTCKKCASVLKVPERLNSKQTNKLALRKDFESAAQLEVDRAGNFPARVGSGW